MTKIDIFSGFLGAGKTTLIKKLIDEVYRGEKLVLIENEFGEIGIDGMFMQEAGIQVNEMTSGCICCSLVGDFGTAMQQVLDEYAPDRILVEPSGVGKLSDVILAVQNIDNADIQLNSFTTVVDAKKCKMYMKNFGEFFNNQVEYANSIILSRTNGMSEDKIAQCVALLREHNQNATIIATPWDQLEGVQILEAMEHRNTLEAELALLAQEAAEDVCPECGEHHRHHHEEGECCCGHDHEHHHHHEEGECCCGHDHEHHHHHHEEGECCCGHDHEHHHHHHEEGECCCGHDHEHHHHHHEEGECCCGHDHEHHHHHEEGECCCGHDHGHHHHHADEVFTSWGVETTAKFTKEALTAALAALEEEASYGTILRAKGAVAGQDGEWLYFDYVPGEADIRTGKAAVIGRLCVIGANIREEALKALFGVA